jgi:hypothetical protein
MVCNNHYYWVSGLCPSSGIPDDGHSPVTNYKAPHYAFIPAATNYEENLRTDMRFDDAKHIHRKYNRDATLNTCILEQVHSGDCTYETCGCDRAVQLTVRGHSRPLVKAN